MRRKFNTNNLACLRGCYDQLRQMLMTVLWTGNEGPPQSKLHLGQRDRE